MFQHLLIPLDGSPLAEAAIPAGVALATRLNCQITLLRVSHSPYIATSMTGAATYAELLNDLNRQSRLEAEGYLADQREKLLAAGVAQVNLSVIESDQITEAILAEIQRSDIDTIIMSTHGRGGISRLVFGSVADKVLRQATIPIILIRATDAA